MEQPTIIITAMTLIAVIAFIFLYLITEKKKKAAREVELNQLKELLSLVETKIQQTANQTAEKFDALAKDVRIAQDQANQKINLSVEQLQNESVNVRKDVAEKIADIKSSFKDYSERVKDSLNTYNKDNLELKEKVQRDLQNLLKEIKAPLDLD